MEYSLDVLKKYEAVLHTFMWNDLHENENNHHPPPAHDMGRLVISGVQPLCTFRWKCSPEAGRGGYFQGGVGSRRVFCPDLVPSGSVLYDLADKVK